MTFVFAHGVEVEDTITGFRGTIIGRTDYMTGCNNYLVQPDVDREGKFVEGRWIDEDRLTQLVASPRQLARKSEKPGGDIPAPKR